MEISSDLTTWDWLQTTNSTKGSFEMVDKTSGQFAYRYYRVVQGVSSLAADPSRVVPSKGETSIVFMPDSGGQLSLTNLDGTIYQLTLPSGALLSPERIGLTLLTDVSFAPFQFEFLAGVQLEPIDLLLMKAATLKLVRPDASTQSLFGFCYAQEGEQFHLFPVFHPGGQSAQIEFHLMRFGGFGLIRDNLEESLELARRVPSDRGFRLESALALFQKEAPPIARQSMNSESNAARIFRAVRDEFYNNVLPRLRAAESADRMLSRALQNYVGWLHELELAELIAASQEQSLESFEIEKKLGNQSAARAIRNAINNTGERARSSHQLWLIRKLIQAGHLLEYPVWADEFSPQDKQRLRLLIRQAASFELKFESRSVFETDSGPITSEVQTRVALDFGGENLAHLHGQESYNFSFIEYPPLEDITVTWSPVGSVLYVLDVALDVNPKDWVDPLALNDEAVPNAEIVKWMAVAIDPGIIANSIPAERFWGTTHGFGGSLGDQYWALGFVTVHGSELETNYSPAHRGAYFFRDFTGKEGEIVAEKRQTSSQDAVTETLTLELHHTPF